MNPIDNILSVYAQASPEEIESGLGWYRSARNFCKENSKKYGVSFEVVIACLSALSPRNKWNQNLKDCVTVLDAVTKGLNPEDVRVCTFNKNKVKAFEIVRQGKPSLVKLSNKTASFFDNIKYFTSEEVTVDVHAYSIYHGKRTPAQGLRDKEYAEVAATYVKAAKLVKLRPYELQACVWVVWLRLTERGYKDVGTLPLAA